MTLKEAEVLALATLKQVMEEKVTANWMSAQPRLLVRAECTSVRDADVSIPHSAVAMERR